MSDVAVAAIGLRRRGVRDVVRTFYIHSTLVLALIGVLVLAGPVLLATACTVDRRRRWTRRVVRNVFPRMIRHYCWLAGHPLVMDLKPLELSEIHFSQRTQRAQRGGKDFQNSSVLSESSVRNRPEVPPAESRTDGEIHCVGPAIVVANHGSSLDSILLMMLPVGLGDGRVWAKGWPFKMPLLGALMKLSGHLLVEDFNLLPDAEESLAGGESLLVFPESSRSRTGKVGRFRDGAFVLAARTGRPVIPVAVHGSFACFPPGQPWVFWPKLKVEVLGILRPQGGNHMALKKQAHEMIEAALEKGRG